MTCIKVMTIEAAKKRDSLFNYDESRVTMINVRSPSSAKNMIMKL